MPITINKTIISGSDNYYIVRAGGVEYWCANTGCIWAGCADVYSRMKGTAMRFTGVNILANTKINSAYLTLKASISQDVGVCNTDLCCENSKNPGVITGFFDHCGRTRTVRVSWDAIPHWDIDTSYQSPDISACIQEVIDDNGGTGDALILFWEDYDYENPLCVPTGGGGYPSQCSLSDNLSSRGGYSYGYGTPPILHIEYTPPHLCHGGSLNSINYFPMKVTVQDIPGDTPNYTGTYTDADWTPDMGNITLEGGNHFPSGIIDSNADCVLVATAFVLRAKQQQERGMVSVPIYNCLQELYDKVQVVDSRGNISTTDRVGAIHFNWSSGALKHDSLGQKYTMRVYLGGLGGNVSSDNIKVENTESVGSDLVVPEATPVVPEVIKTVPYITPYTPEIPDQPVTWKVTRPRYKF